MNDTASGGALLRVPDHDQVRAAFSAATDEKGEPLWASPGISQLHDMRRFYLVREIARITGAPFDKIRKITSPNLRNFPESVEALVTAYRRASENSDPETRHALDLLIGNARNAGWSLRAIGAVLGVGHPQQVRLLNPTGPTTESGLYPPITPRPGNVVPVPRSMRADAEGNRITSRRLTEDERRVLRRLGSRLGTPYHDLRYAARVARIRADSGQCIRHLSRVSGLPDSRASTLISEWRGVLDLPLPTTGA